MKPAACSCRVSTSLIFERRSESSTSIFFQRSPPRLFTAAAWSGLRPAPASRSRGTCPHLSRSFTTLCCPPFHVSLQHTEAEEVEGFRLPLSAFLTLLGRVAAKADQPGFVRVQRQFELAHSLLEIVKERLCLVLMLKADDGVVRIADDDHVA